MSTRFGLYVCFYVCAAILVVVALCLIIVERDSLGLIAGATSIVYIFDKICALIEEDV